MRAMAARDLDAARSLLERAVALAPDYIPAWLNLSGARRARGDLRGALDAVEQVLRVEPRAFLGHLLKASLLERVGEARAAARHYGIALAQAPDAEALDGPTRAALHHAGVVDARNKQEMERSLRARLPADDPSEPAAKRVTAFLDTYLGKRRIYRQEPVEYFYPGLPAREFHDRADFPWLEELEAATDVIAQDLARVLAQDAGSLEPYMAYPEGVPLDQWAELNHSPRWSAYHLLKAGERIESHCALCPATMAILERMPQPRLQRRSPAAMFSVLRPHTRIPPHTGVANTRLVVHLPLIVPLGCGFRVGAETREWKRGEAFVFDDTIEHEAWNDSDQDRVVLIFDIWAPALSLPEREGVAAIMAGLDAFADPGAEPGAGPGL